MCDSDSRYDGSIPSTGASERREGGNMYIYLPDVIEDKLIPRNFGHIEHLSGSKMIDNEDKLLNLKAQEKFTQQKQYKNDIVIITEKIDGMNAGVLKRNGVLYPINRKGYDTRTMGKVHKELQMLGEKWAQWVDNHYDIYNQILQEGERLAFENAIMQHTLAYHFKGDPVFLLAKYTSDNMKVNYHDLCEIGRKYDIAQPPLLNIGIALPPQLILDQYPKGKAGVEGQIEGVVYNYEHDGKHVACAKYVSNPLMGTINASLTRENKFKS